MSNVVLAGGHPAWHRPAGVAAPLQLTLRNSLTDTKEVFTPAEGNIVRMYVCGPTVYSVSHMGHARTFLSFDILRRVLEKYFRFNVLYQMNITDIDDKIILTARKNELVKQYVEENHSAAETLSLVRSLIAASHDELSAKLAFLKANIPPESSREFAEHDTAIKQAELKIEQLGNITADLEATPNEAVSVGKDLLANHLDKSKGHSIDDKAIFDAHARYYEKEFLDDCKSLRIRAPDVLTRVTEYVDEVVTFIEKIEANGFAYESNGSVYFDTQKFKQSHDYPKLVPHAGSGATDAEIAEGEGALGGNDVKKHRNDFALWKKSKAGEPKWDSPWGEGRPGWHIECSVMATAIHGPVLDAHLGGVDLKFPHHDNEIAQTEAHYDTEQWTNYFLHAGHLHIKGLKMAKSLKNFITIRQALEKYTPRQIRIMFLLQQWDRPMNFSDQTMSEARDKETRFNSFLARVASVERNFPIHASIQKWDAIDNRLAEAVLATQEGLHAALCDNFDTPTAMTKLEECVSAVNQYLIEQPVPKFPLLSRARSFVSDMLSIFGVIDSDEATESAGSSERTSSIVSEFVSLRDRIRELATATKNPELMRLSDTIRDETFVNLGIKVVDGATRSELWSFANPEDLMKEIQLRAAEKREKEVLKFANKVAVIKKELMRYEKFEQTTNVAQILFPDQAGAALDEDGIPMGMDLSGSKRKSLKKDIEKLGKEVADFHAKGGVAFLNQMRGEIKELESRMSN
jgi:cysteinyl-tRNA synthetase